MRRQQLWHAAWMIGGQLFSLFFLASGLHYGLHGEYAHGAFCLVLSVVLEKHADEDYRKFQDLTSTPRVESML